MPSDSYYDRLDEAEDNRYYKRKKDITDRINKMTLEEKVELLINDYINKVTTK